MITRRKLLIALGANALVAPLGSFAQQQGKVWRVGFLGESEQSFYVQRLDAFKAGMRELGYVEGKNLVIETRFADSKYERLPGLVVEMIELKVNAIVAVSTRSISASQKATITIPIVMVNAGDPVGSGFVASLARPGGNITGLTNMLGDVSPKHLEMLVSMVPKLVRVGVLVNPPSSTQATILNNVRAAAQRTGLKILPVEARTPQDIESAFSTLAQQNAGAVIVLNNPFFGQQQRQIVGLATKNRLPSIYAIREFVEIGGLMSYGVDTFSQFRRAATYVDKILKGAKPGDLPVEQPMKLELVINRKTAKVLGIKIPQSLLISADKVIE
jgi:putative ABC transport system substrate-binding protein